VGNLTYCRLTGCEEIKNLMENAMPNINELWDKWLYKWLCITEFFWRFHPRRNRWCKKCGDFIGNSKAEERQHDCQKHL